MLNTSSNFTLLLKSGLGHRPELSLGKKYPKFKSWTGKKEEQPSEHGNLNSIWVQLSEIVFLICEEIISLSIFLSSKRGLTLLGPSKHFSS